MVIELSQRRHAKSNLKMCYIKVSWDRKGKFVMLWDVLFPTWFMSWKDPLKGSVKTDLIVSSRLGMSHFIKPKQPLIVPAKIVLLPSRNRQVK